ncbi:DUF4365 domain-containing protein [Paraburkholderia terrae]|nr:DUF4365 domain-containing protein [Paraburkholderia terrae]
MNAVERIVMREMGWIFREQLVVDMGIDAQIELVLNGNPTGRLMAVQIKAGPSHVKEKGDAFEFRGSRTHLDYWSNHSLPVILVLHLPQTDATYWVHVEPSEVRVAGKTWTIQIPKRNRLGPESIGALTSLFDGTSAQQRLRRLAMDEPLMRHIVSGGKVCVELEDWINKSLGRSPIQVYVYDKHGDEALKRQWHVLYTGFTPRTLASALFPWAKAYVDEEFYEENEDEDPDSLPWMRADDEFSSPQRDPEDVYPYTNSSGEVDYYRLRLFLNALGEAYLTVHDFMVQKR